MDLPGCRREPTIWVAFESTTPQPIKPKRRKGARGRATPEEMATMVESRGRLSRREQQLRPEQIEALRLKREPKDHSVTCIDQEDEEGNVEYKYRIKDPHPVRLQQLITQMKYRLSEGNGECFYYIGVEDNGYPKGLEPAELAASIATLHHMAASLGAAAAVLTYLPAAWGRRAALLRVATSTAQEARHTDLRIVVAGSVDAGKSTLVAVLTHGSGGKPMLDNGRGLARMNVFRHKHEMQSGRTSSICHQLLGYDAEGQVMNYASPEASPLTPAEITAASRKVLTFLDMGGHEKYLKTALYGMTALLPHFGLLCVCAVGGLGRIAREHLAVAVALEVPVAVVVTKVELVRAERLAAVVGEVRQLVALTMRHEAAAGGLPAAAAAAAAGGGGGRQNVRAGEAAAAEQQRVEDASPLITTELGALSSAAILCQLHADSLASATARGALRVHMPIFPVSAVTGAGLPVLHAFLSALQPGTPLKGAGSGPLSAAAGSGPLSAAGGSGPLSEAASMQSVQSAASVASTVASSATALLVDEGSSGGGSRSSSVGGGGGCAEEDGDSSPRSGADHDSFSYSVVATKEPGQEAAVPVLGATDVGLQQQQQHRLLYAPATQRPAGAQQPLQPPFSSPQSPAATVIPAAAAAVAAAEVPAEAQAVHFQVDGTFEVEGVGSVVSGTLVSGIVRLGQQLMLGPTAAGDFTRVVVRQLQRSHVQVQQVRAGQTCTIAISPVAPVAAVDTAAEAVVAAGLDAADSRNAVVAAGGSTAGYVQQLPLGSSPGVVVRGAVLASAAVAVTAMGNGSRHAASQSPGVAAPGQLGGSGGGGCNFEDALAAAQSALEGCLTGGSDMDDAAAPPDDDLFAFDSPSPPAVAPKPTGRSASFAAALQLPSTSTTSISTSAARPLHSTTSFCSGSLGPGPLSTSAPTRSMSVNEGLSGRARGARPGAGPGMGANSWTTPFCSCMTPPRKGAVLLEPALQPRTSWTFEAVLILLGGHWPPRGLLSGRWPPVGADEPQGAAMDAAQHAALQAPPPQAPPEAFGAEGLAGGVEGREGSGKEARRQRGQRRQRSGGAGTFVTVVHCGSVRQPAHVLMVQELFEEEQRVAGEVAGQQQQQLGSMGNGNEGGSGNSCFSDLRISASTRAAAALLHSARHLPDQQQQGARSTPCTNNSTGTYSSSGGGAANDGGSGGGGLAAAGHAPQAHVSSDHDLGCLVRVVLRWQHRPEWLREGAKLLLRDRCDGRVAGAGFVRRVLL